jgi:proline-rich protein PRCC
VLGGGGGPGLVFRAPASVQEDGEEEKEASTSFLPPSLKKGKSNIALDREDYKPPTLPKVSSAPAVDFFSISMLPTPTSLHVSYLLPS